MGNNTSQQEATSLLVYLNDLNLFSVGSSLFVICFIYFHKLGKYDSYFLICNLAVATLFLDLFLWFIIEVAYIPPLLNEAICITLMILVMYFKSASVFWSTILSCYMYLILKKGITKLSNKMKWQSMSLGWILPIIPASVVFSVENDVGFQTHYYAQNQCWIWDEGNNGSARGLVTRFILFDVIAIICSLYSIYLYWKIFRFVQDDLNQNLEARNTNSRTTFPQETNIRNTWGSPSMVISPDPDREIEMKRQTIQAIFQLIFYPLILFLGNLPHLILTLLLMLKDNRPPLAFVAFVSIMLNSQGIVEMIVFFYRRRNRQLLIHALYSYLCTCSDLLSGGKRSDIIRPEETANFSLSDGYLLNGQKVDQHKNTSTTMKYISIDFDQGEDLRSNNSEYQNYTIQPRTDQNNSGSIEYNNPVIESLEIGSSNSNSLDLFDDNSL